jgi:polysaccharide biosynthesis/export protein
MNRCNVAPLLMALGMTSLAGAQVGEAVSCCTVAGHFMQLSLRKLWLKQVALVFISVSSAAWLWGQNVPSTTAKPGTPVAVASLGQPVSASTSKPHDDSFVIGNDDVLAINVWKEPEISRSIPVRSDGKISLPLVGEVQAAGRTPLKLEQDIAGKLRSYIEEPEVTVMVQQINSEKFNILGQVTHPGSYPLTNSATVLDAIALAGGFRDFAKQKAIYVLRQNPGGGQSRIPFNYKNLVKGKNPEQNIKLEPRDTIVVP